MIVNEHIRDYIVSLDGDTTPELVALEESALAGRVPIIRRDAQTLLKFMLQKEKPGAILEIGTAVGFSTLFMEQYAPADAHITTIEKVEMRLKEARRNLAGHDRITLLEGDAAGVLRSLTGSYDFVFLDAAKGQYSAFLPDILRLMHPGSILVTDNVLLEGTIAESKFSIERRDRTIHMRMKEYLYDITHRPELDTVVLPVGDGMSISVMRADTEADG